MNTLSEKEINEGWHLLFDGKSLQGWHRFNFVAPPLGWVVEGDTLHFNGHQRDEATRMICNDLVTDAVYLDFHLTLEWKISVNGNSGIMFLVQEEAQYRTPWMTGPEMQVLDNEGHKDGQFIKHRAGDLYDLIECSTKTVKPVGEWNSTAIILQNNRLQFFQNGSEVISTILWDEQWDQLVAGSKFKDMPDFAKSRSGKIALQDHCSPVWFRNIKLKPL